MITPINFLENIIKKLSQYPAIGKFLANLFGFIEVPLLNFLHLIDTIKPGFLKQSMKIFSLFYKSKIVPLNIKVAENATISPTEEILSIVKRLPAVSIGYCYCRSKQKKCDNPLWTCIHIGTAKHLDEQAKKIPLKKSNIEEIERLLLDSDKRGLIHQLITAPTPDYIYVICNCCPCCCVMLNNMINYHLKGVVISSKFYVETLREKCLNCGSCIVRCYFGARTMLGKKLTYEINKCVGCGLCVNSCPNNATILKKR